MEPKKWSLVEVNLAFLTDMLTLGFWVFFIYNEVQNSTTTFPFK